MTRVLLASVGFAVAGLLLAAWHWAALPDPMPTHWNAAGQADGFMPRAVGVSIAPLMSLLMPVFIVGVTRLDPRREHVERSDGAVHTIALAIAAFGFGLQWLTLGAATSPDRTLDGTGLLVLLGLLYLVVGNAITKARSNWFVGIRTPWTLQSEKVWHRTHRVGGWTFAGAGGLTLLAAALLPAQPALYVSLAAVVVASGVPVVYSYVIYEPDEV